MNKPFIIGIFGPIGSGKSTVAGLFREKGFVSWDADEAVSKLYMAGGAGAKKIGEFFGYPFLMKDGSVSKKKLGRLVLSHPAKMRILEHIIHPLVVNDAQHWIDEQKKAGNFHLVLESAAFESADLGRFPDVFLRVTSDESLCRERVLARGKDDAYFNAMLHNFRDYKTDHEIVNNWSLEDLKKVFEKVFSSFTMNPI